MSSIKSCPFCGWDGVKLQKKERNAYWLELLVAEIRIEKAAYYVVCNRCKARGGVATGSFIGSIRTYDFCADPFGDSKARIPVPEWVTTRDKVKQRAIEAWNRRAE